MILEMREVGRVGGWVDQWLPTYLPTYLASMYDQGRELCALPSRFCSVLEGWVWTYETRRTLWLWVWVDDATRRGGGVRMKCRLMCCSVRVGCRGWSCGWWLGVVSRLRGGREKG